MLKGLNRSLNMTTEDIATIRDVSSVKEKVAPEEWRSRVDLAACYRLVRANGWNMNIFNHASVRVPGEPDYFFINAHTLLWDEVTASYLVKVNTNEELDEKSLVNRPGFVLHSAILRAREDVNAIVHIHEDACVAISTTKEGFLPLTQDAVFLYGQVAYHEYTGITEDAEEREAIIDNLGNKTAMLMRNHGSVTVGKTTQDAYSRTRHLVKASQIQLQLIVSGAESIIPSEKVCRHTLQQHMEHNSGRGLDDWPAALRELDRIDYTYRH